MPDFFVQGFKTHWCKSNQSYVPKNADLYLVGMYLFKHQTGIISDY